MKIKYDIEYIDNRIEEREEEFKGYGEFWSLFTQQEMKAAGIRSVSLRAPLHIPDDLYYKIASSVMDQGIRCDRLARLICITLPDYLASLEKLVQIEMRNDRAETIRRRIKATQESI